VKPRTDQIRSHPDRIVCYSLYRHYDSAGNSECTLAVLPVYLFAHSDIPCSFLPCIRSADRHWSVTVVNDCDPLFVSDSDLVSCIVQPFPAYSVLYYSRCFHGDFNGVDSGHERNHQHWVIPPLSSSPGLKLLPIQRRRTKRS